MTAGTGWLVIIVLIIAVCMVILMVVIRSIKSLNAKARELLGGAGDLMWMLREARKAADNFETEEKSLCAMTGLMLPLIERDFPEFDWDEYRAKVDEHVADHIIERLKGVKPVIHRTEISDYRRNQGCCTIDAQSSAGYQQGGKTVEKRFTTQITYVQDYLNVPAGQTGVGLNCPNCGAPVKILGNKRCEYCGTAIREINRRVWKILDTREF